MTTYLHHPTGLAPYNQYRVDSHATNGTVATITRVDPSTTIDASKVQAGSDGTVAPFLGSAATLYLRPLDYLGAPGTAVTSTGGVYPAPAPDTGAQTGGAVQRTGETGTVDLSGATVTLPAGTTGLTKTTVGLPNVSNTSDAAKPVSTAQQAALDLKAPLASPTFTGPVTVPTPTASGQAANKAYVDSATSGTIRRAAAGVRATLDRGSRSTCILAIGDSTGDERLEWFGVLGDRLAAAFPTYSVIMRTWSWDGSSDEYGPEVAISSGTGNGGGDRYVDIPSGSTLYSANSSTYTNDISYRAKILPTGGWAPGGAAASRTIVSRYNASGSSRHSWFYLDETGHLKFTWSAAGTADTGTATSSAAVGFSTGTAGWVRVDFDSDNTASGSTTKFYTSTDGVTWTQLGSDVVIATASSLSASTYQFQLGNRNATPSDSLNGRIYWVEARSTLSTSWAPIIPYVPAQWRQGLNGSSITYGGAPVLLLLNGHVSGTAISYYNDSVRRIKMHGQFGQQLVILSEGHNEGTINGPDWRVAYDAWVADAKNNRSKFIPFVLIAQNPAGSPGDSIATIANGLRADRGRDIIAYAASQAGCYPLDVYPLFIAAANGDLSALIPDNIHPGQGSGSGSELWGNYVYSQLFT